MLPLYRRRNRSQPNPTDRSPPRKETYHLRPQSTGNVPENMTQAVTMLLAVLDAHLKGGKIRILLTCHRTRTNSTDLDWTAAVVAASQTACSIFTKTKDTVLGEALVKLHQSQRSQNLCHRSQKLKSSRRMTTLSQDGSTETN